jgi:redox-sensitive bicupin YhaK (pirin superfamily)
LPEKYSTNKWRKIAGNTEGYPLEIRSNTQIRDIRLEKDQHEILPITPGKNQSILLYVFDGKIKVNEKLTLEKGESVLIENGSPTFTAIETSDVVLFITNKDSIYFERGMYSGNQKQ